MSALFQQGQEEQVYLVVFKVQNVLWMLIPQAGERYLRQERIRNPAVKGVARCT